MILDLSLLLARITPIRIKGDRADLTLLYELKSTLRTTSEKKSEHRTISDPHSPKSAQAVTERSVKWRP